MKLDTKMKLQLPLALGLSLFSIYSIRLPVIAADSTVAKPTATEPSAVIAQLNADGPITLSISNIYLNDSKQLVVEFDNPTHATPASPQVRDYPGEHHDIVLEFPQTSFAVDKTPKAKFLLANLMKVYPSLSSVAYATASDGKRARIRIGVSPKVSAHPSLATVGQNSAVINLDLSEETKNSEVSAAPAENKSEQKVSTSSPINTAVAPAASTPANSGKGLKGAWTSSFKAGQNHLSQIAKLGDKINPLTRFGHSQLNTKLSTPLNTDIASGAGLAKPPARPAEAKTAEPSSTIATSCETAIANPTAVVARTTLTNPTRAAADPSTNVQSVDNTATVPVSVASLPSSSNPVVSVPSAVTALPDTAAAVSSPSKAAPDAVPSIASAAAISTTRPLEFPAEALTSIGEIPKTDTTQTPNTTNQTSLLNPEITESPLNIPTTAKNDQLSGNDIQITSPLSSTEKNQTILARIPAAPEGGSNDTNSNEAIVTPLSVEQVLKEKASQSVENAKAPVESNVPQPIVSKESNGDNSIISDLKTSFSQPKTEALGSPSLTKEKEAGSETKDNKDEPDKIASALPNSLDSLTSAAINNNSETPAQNTIESQTKESSVQLKAQKASKGGKDYLPPRFSDEAVEHYNKAVHLHLNGKLPAAAVEYKAAAEADPKIAEAFSNLGLIYNQQRQYDMAMTEFHKALAINPKDAITYNGIGAAMRAKNNMLAAIKNWKTAISLDPNLASAHYNLGTAYELQKDLENALAEYKEAVKHDDKLGEAYYRMGLILQRMNNKGLALQEYKNAVKISQQATYSTDAKRRINLLSQTKNQSM